MPLQLLIGTFWRISMGIGHDRVEFGYLFKALPSNRCFYVRHCGLLGQTILFWRTSTISPITTLWTLVVSKTPLSDPSGSSALVDAARWVNGALLGTLATTIAVIAVAFVGFAMLSGRINWRKGLTAILGCFLLFGARAIVGGLVPSGEAYTSSAVAGPLPPPSDVPPELDVYDPYAGAAPNREGS